jgi:hypothetical protein
MKRLAAVAVMLVGLCCGVCAQRGGGGGGGGSHGGFSSPGGGFSRSAPAFRGGSSMPRSGFVAPPRYVGPARLGPHPSPNPIGGLRLGMGGTRTPFTTSKFRAPYRCTSCGKLYRSGYRYPFRHIVFLNTWWPFWGWPYWSLSYPFWPIFPDDSDDNDLQQPSSYLAPPFQPQSQDQQGPAPIDQQQPSAYYRVPYEEQAPPPPSAPVTIVFKDGRPAEKIYNFVLTNNTLSVFDQPLRDIPVDQIDVAATAKVNNEVGVRFTLPTAH